MGCTYAEDKEKKLPRQCKCCQSRYFDIFKVVIKLFNYILTKGLLTIGATTIMFVVPVVCQMRCLTQYQHRLIPI